MNTSIALPKKLSDADWLKQMLTTEKDRRGVLDTSLVFVGMHNIAQYWWCAMYSVLKSRQNELDFFGAYLHDRLTYSLRTGRISKLPREDIQLLEVGNDLSFDEIEALYKPDIEATSEDVFAENQPRKIDRGVTYRTANPLERGEQDQLEFAERYPSFRWNFPYSKYVVVGVPDGVTKHFVYEFKSTSKRFFLSTTKPVALTQADIYGLFFRKQRKRVQVLIKQEGIIETFGALVDEHRAKETLSKFESVDSGKSPRPPIQWKCKHCEYRDQCSISQA